MAIEWLIPWHPVVSEDDERGLVAVLRRELGQAHVLYRESVRAIARRQDNDDVLFELTDGRVAVVHLTWSESPSPFANFPWTTLYATIEEFAQKDMIPEHAEWGQPNAAMDRPRVAHSGKLIPARRGAGH
jgi:hypothetical protein